jgi:hypothetical protein
VTPTSALPGAPCGPLSRHLPFKRTQSSSCPAHPGFLHLRYGPHATSGRARHPPAARPPARPPAAGAASGSSCPASRSCRVTSSPSAGPSRVSGGARGRTGGRRPFPSLQQPLAAPACAPAHSPFLCLAFASSPPASWRPCGSQPLRSAPLKSLGPLLRRPRRRVPGRRQGGPSGPAAAGGHLHRRGGRAYGWALGVFVRTHTQTHTHIHRAVPRARRRAGRTCAAAACHMPHSYPYSAALSFRPDLPPRPSALPCRRREHAAVEGAAAVAAPRRPCGQGAAVVQGGARGGRTGCDGRGRRACGSAGQPQGGRAGRAGPGALGSTRPPGGGCSGSAGARVPMCSLAQNACGASTPLPAHPGAQAAHPVRRHQGHAA